MIKRTISSHWSPQKRTGTKNQEKNHRKNQRNISGPSFSPSSPRPQVLGGRLLLSVLGNIGFTPIHLESWTEKLYQKEKNYFDGTNRRQDRNRKRGRRGHGCKEIPYSIRTPRYTPGISLCFHFPTGCSFASAIRTPGNSWPSAVSG